MNKQYRGNTREPTSRIPETNTFARLTVLESPDSVLTLLLYGQTCNDGKLRAAGLEVEGPTNPEILKIAQDRKVACSRISLIPCGEDVAEGSCWNSCFQGVVLAPPS